MSKGFKVLVLCLCLLMASACQSPPVHVLGTPPEEKPAIEKQHSVPFRPYADTEVPPLKDLTQRKGFDRYVREKVYLLGSSYDGMYLATIVYEKRADAYRIDIHHTGNNRVESTVYAPVATRLKQELKNGPGSEAEELLQVTQETLDMGYRIKVPVRPKEWAWNRNLTVKGRRYWKVSPRLKGKDYELFVEDGKGHRWKWGQERLERGGKPVSPLLLGSLPKSDGKWSVIASVRHEDGEIQPLVYTVDESLLNSSWSEQRLKERVDRELNGKTQIIYRGALSRKGPDTLLAVTGESRSMIRKEEGLLYRGRVRGFAIWDDQGRVRIRGDTHGLIRDEREFIDPFPSSDPSIRYELLLSFVRGGKQERELLLTVDQVHPKNGLIRTYQLKWDPKEKQFLLVGETE